MLSAKSRDALEDIVKAATTRMTRMADKFPESLPGFQKMFPDDAACARYLEAIRWRDGFFSRVLAVGLTLSESGKRAWAIAGVRRRRGPNGQFQGGTR